MHPTSTGQNLFQTTAWDLVQALSSSEGEANRDHWEELTQRYWPAIYSFLRAKKWSREDAMDLTQDFFFYLMDKDLLLKADSAKGRFRSYLLGILTRFISDERDRRNAQKRRGDYQHLSLHDLENWQEQGSFSDEPEYEFHRRWAITLLQRVLQRMQEECKQKDKLWQYEAVYVLYFDPKSHKLSGKALAKKLGLEPESIADKLRSARLVYGRLLREEVAKTVRFSTEIDDEIKHLLSCLK
ncbi:MAG: sigma-70 family RNA polymerase sigma factor [Planctomycetes bacterium]|nr:sigma-70 family RNA polymerase sigma factor [Planctomycetota bacterium]